MSFSTDCRECDHPAESLEDFEVEGFMRTGCHKCGAMRRHDELCWIDRTGKRIPLEINCPDGSHGLIYPGVTI